jgi:hypothetical protein
VPRSFVADRELEDHSFDVVDHPGRPHGLCLEVEIGLVDEIGRVDVDRWGFVVAVERRTDEIEKVEDFEELGSFVFDRRVHSTRLAQHTIVYRFPWE